MPSPERHRDREWGRGRDRDRDADRDQPRIPWKARNTSSMNHDRQRDVLPSLPLQPHSRRSCSPRDRYRGPPRADQSPDGQRQLDDSRYRRPDSPEPGPILDPRERSPRATRPYVPRIDRAVFGSDPPDFPGSTTEALKSFSNVILSTLISTSAHSLALQHFTRLAKFPHTNPTSTTFEGAQKRVADAEKVLNEQMTKLQAAFAELIKRTMSKPGVAQGDVTGLELDSLRERMIRLEEMTSKSSFVLPRDSAPPVGPASSATSAPLPPRALPIVSERYDIVPGTAPQDTSTDGTRERKRERLRDMLDAIISRLESVEAMRNTLEERCDGFENQLDLWVGADLDDSTLSWDQLENKRDPTGRLRGLESRKGKEKEIVVTADGGDMVSMRESEEILALRREVRTLSERMAAGLSSGSAEPLSSLQAENQRLLEEFKAIREDTTIRDQVERLQARITSSSQVTNADSTATHVAANITQLQSDTKTLMQSRDAQASQHVALAQQVVTLQKEIQNLRTELKVVTDGREQWTREVMTACLTAVKEDVQEDYAKIAKREISSFVKDFMAKRAKVTPEPSVSPATKAERLPSATTHLASQAASPPQATAPPPPTSIMTNSVDHPVQPSSSLLTPETMQRSNSNPLPPSHLATRPTESIPPRPSSATINSIPQAAQQLPMLQDNYVAHPNSSNGNAIGQGGFEGASKLP